MNLFTFYESIIKKISVKLPFTIFQWSVLELIRVAPSQLNVNAWLMLVASEYLCLLFKLCHGSFSFFYFFQHSSRSKGSYLIKRPSVPYVFTKLSTSQKWWKDTFIKVVRRLEKKGPYWILSTWKLAFPIKWSTMEKKDFQRV